MGTNLVKTGGTTMTRTYMAEKRVLSLLLCLALLLSYFPRTLFASAATAYSAAEVVGTVADPGTAYTWETMMGSDSDGNRYSGRLWVDKSVYTNGQTALLNTRGEATSSFHVALEADEAFQIIFSALGSSMASTSTVSATGPMDVVIILDNSSSMGRYTDSAAKYSRLEAVTDASNALISQILSSDQNRLAVVTYSTDATVILPLNSYEQNDQVLTLSAWSKGDADSSGGVRVEDGDGRMTATATIRNTTTTAGATNNGFQRGTNLQSGIDAGMRILGSAADTANRTPVVIVLTDGVADTAVTSNWYDVSSGTYRQPSDNTLTEGVALSTLLNAAYWRATLEDTYGKSPVVYGIGVDLGENSDAEVVMNPAKAFSANGTTLASTAYSWFTAWRDGSGSIQMTDSQNVFWTFTQLPSDSQVTKADVTANINYVDTYYPVSSAKLDTVFTQIFEELSSGAFNPISSTTTVVGGTGVEETPLIYVDNIGQYMEIKQIQAVTVFGVSYEVVKNSDGTYTVETGTGTNPTTNETYITSEDIQICVTENEDGTQRLEVYVNQEILPIILEQVQENTVGDSNSVTITELVYDPLRVYYTVGLASDILLPSGQVDISKIDSDYAYVDDAAGQVTFYSNAFGDMNAPQTDGTQLLGDAHVGFRPAAMNRYYYHQSNQGIFTQITNKADGSTVAIADNNQYGILWDEDLYNLSRMDYADYLAMEDDDQVYTYVTYYRPTESASDAASAAEKVTYLVYTLWGYLKESVAFYDATTGKYVNYDSETGTWSYDDEGYVVEKADIAAFAAANPEAQLYAVLGVGSHRTSRLHNMTVGKSENATGTAQIRYAPEYTYETAESHHGNDVVVWLGNNGRLTTAIDTGIALTKAVTESIGNADDTYAITVTVPEGVDATPVVRDEAGNDVTDAISTYSGNVLTVNLKAGQTVYISGIPAGTQCLIGESIAGDYYIESQTESVIIPTVSQVLAGTPQFVAATVTNAPYKYGNLYITKEIVSDHNIPASVLAEEFTVRVHVGTALAGKTFPVEGVEGITEVTVGDDGSFLLTVTARHTVEVLNLPVGTVVTITEEMTDAQKEIFQVVYRTRDHSGAEADADNSVTITANANSTTVITNTYTPRATTVDLDITGTKNFVSEAGVALPEHTFTFKVQQWNGNEWVDLEGMTAQAAYGAGETGERTFTIEDVLAGIEYTQVGSWSYQVLEVKGDDSNVTYDRTLYTFTVTVTDVDGTLVAAITDMHNTAITGEYEVTFTNTYHTAPISIDITKDVGNYSGDPTVSKGGFIVVARQTDDAWNILPDGEVLSVVTDSAGTARLTKVYTQAGTYYYIISEENAAAPGWDFSVVKYYLTVTVTEDNGDLTATMTIEAADTRESGEEAVTNGNSATITIVNNYDPTDATVDLSPVVRKNLTGRALEAGEFTFHVYENGTANLVLTGTNKADGTIVFDGELVFDRVGKYEFDVVEVSGNLPGVTYDTTIFDLVVEVTNDMTTGELVAVYYFEDAVTYVVTFRNVYTVKSVDYAIGGTKRLTGRAHRAGEFTFALYQGEDLLETVTNKADGTFRFSTITYTAPGEYVYTIREVEGDAPGVSYDGVKAPVTVTVTVVDMGGYLVATADISNEEISFVNHYEAAPAEVSFGGTKTLLGGELQDGDFTFRLYQTDNTFDITARSATLVATAENADGKFDLGTVVYEAPGNYFYVIVEDAAVNTLENVVYDSTQYRFHVQVTDVGNGQLLARIQNLDAGAISEFWAAHEVEVGFTNATFDEVVEKEVYYEGDVTTMIDGKKVQPGDILTYYITYTNYTGEDKRVDILDTIPEHTTYVEGSASHNGTYAGGHLNWVLTVAKGESVTVSFDVRVDDTGAVVENTAIVRDGTNTYVTNEVTNHTIEEVAEKDVANAEDLTVSIDGEAVKAGDILVYTITFTNATNAPVDVTITDMIPQYTTYVEGSADNGGVFADGKITWVIEELAAYASVTVSFQVTVEDVENVVIANEAQILVGENSFTTNEVTNYTEEKIPETGDSGILMWLAMAMVGGTGLFGTVACRRKEETEEN